MPDAGPIRWCRGLAALLLVAVPCSAQEAPARPAPTTLEGKLERLFEDWDRQDRPGGAVVVVQDGKVVFQKAYGLACLEWNVPNTVRTVFNADGLGRPLAAWAAVQMAGEGKLSLEDPVHKHLPELPDFGQPLRVRHLLEQTSGLPAWSALWSFTGRSLEGPIGIEAVLELIRSKRRLAFAPGARVQETDSNAVLLAEVVRRAAGESLRDWTWRCLFRPLKMHRTLFRDKARELIDDRAFGYNFSQQESYLRGADGLSLVGGHSFLTSAEDLGRLLLHLQAPAGPPEWPKALLDPQPGAKVWMGWTVEARKGHRRLTVQGSWGGFRAALTLVPARRLAMAVLSNWDYSFHNPRTFVDELQDLYLPSAAASAPPATSAGLPVDAALLKACEGRFRMRPGAFYELRAEAGGLVLAVSGQSYPLRAVAPDRFYLAVAGADLRLQRDAAGRVQALAWDPDGEPMPRVEPWKATAEDLPAFVGSYRNAELDVTCAVALKEGRLLFRHPRLGEFPLRPEARDHFLCTAPAMPLLAFARDGSGRVIGLHVETEKLRDLRLERLP